MSVQRGSGSFLKNIRSEGSAMGWAVSEEVLGGFGDITWNPLCERT